MTMLNCPFCLAGSSSDRTTHIPRGLTTILALILLTGAATASSSDRRGTVVEVTGRSIVAQFELSDSAKPGDLVRIAFDVPRVGLLDLQGKWRVVRVEGTRVFAEPVGETGQPRVGQAAFIPVAASSRQSPVQTSESMQLLGETPSETDGIPMIPSVPPPGEVPRGIQITPEDPSGVESAAPKATESMPSPTEAQREFPDSPPEKTAPTAVDYLAKGRAYAFPETGEPDYLAAVPYLRKAAEMGDLMATFELAWVYLQDRSSLDREEALSWLQKAANAEYPDAEFVLGLLYEGEFGVLVPDLPQATLWYRRASAHGHPEATKRLMELSLPD